MLLMRTLHSHYALVSRHVPSKLTSTMFSPNHSFARHVGLPMFTVHTVIIRAVVELPWRIVGIVIGITDLLHDARSDLGTFRVERNADRVWLSGGGQSHVVQRLLVILSDKRSNKPDFQSTKRAKLSKSSSTTL